MKTQPRNRRSGHPQIHSTCDHGEGGGSLSRLRSLWTPPLGAVLAVSLGATWMASGCKSTPETQSPRPRQTLESSPPPRRMSVPKKEPKPKRKVSDVTITAEVKRRLLEDALADHNVDVAVKKGVVTLSGSTANLRGKRRAKRIAESIKGVISVVNSLKVKPHIRSDQELKKDIGDALAQDPATRSYEITVDAKGGIVTLQGTVDSFMAKTSVERVASRVRGVAEIQNTLTIKYSQDRPDKSIAGDIESRLSWDMRIDAELLEVEVSNGQVTLKGLVGSAAEKELAYTKAWVAGVQSVNTDQVKVSWMARDRLRRLRKVVTKPDKIRAAILKTFSFDPRVHNFKIDVQVKEGGTVTLQGKVSNLLAKRAARRNAENTMGVVSVSNHIKVNPNHERTEAQLALAASKALQRDSNLARYRITASAVNGEVHLEGVVPTAFDKRLAESVVAGVEGVSAISNNLLVNGKNKVKQDWKILGSLETALFWNPTLDSYQIQPKVEGGVVTLSGQVDNWRERVAAEFEARKAGAWRVRNKLRIHPLRLDDKSQEPTAATKKN